MTARAAYVLFGGICSGKTTLADRLETFAGTEVISTDRLSYEKDLAARLGVRVDSRQERERRIQSSTARYLILDEMMKEGSLDSLLALGYSLTAIYLNIPTQVRAARFHERLALKYKSLLRLSEILGIDVTRYERPERRRLWIDPSFCEGVPQEYRTEFEALIKELYVTGGQILDDREPDPNSFEGIDYVIELDEMDDTREATLDELMTKRTPFTRYRNERAGRMIDLCIWDIGNVLYRYSLNALADLTLARSRNPQRFDEARRRFSFDQYMRGNITFPELCRLYCEAFDVEPTPSIENEVETALRAGIGAPCEVCRETILLLRNQGIESAILSNALQVLENEGSYHDLFRKEMMFYSFNTGFLKPEREAYLHVLSTVGARPENTLFIDDQDKNVIAATELGIAAIRFVPETFKRELSRQLRRTLGTS